MDPKSRLRKTLASLLLGVVATASGCAGLSDAKYECTQRLRAVNEFKDCGVPDCECYPHDYKLGFLKGFYTVSTGGPDCPPPVAPAKYYRPEEILNHCDNKRHAYYRGWQDGAARAACYPDTHYLRLFETCECKMPRCNDGCCTPTIGSCQTCAPGGATIIQGVAPGMIHEEWNSGATVGEDGMYAMPAPIASQVDMSSDDDVPAAEADAEQEPGSDDAPDAEGTEAAEIEAEEAAEANGPIEAATPDAEASTESVEPPSPSDLPSNNDGAVNKSIRAVEPPAWVKDFVSDNSVSTASVSEVQTDEIATDVAMKDADQLTQEEVEELFGIFENIEEDGQGIVDFQAVDPATRLDGGRESNAAAEAFPAVRMSEGVAGAINRRNKDRKTVEPTVKYVK